MPIETPYNQYKTVVQSDWIDFNGHLNVAYYHLIFAMSATPFFNWLGFTEQWRLENRVSTFALETHLCYLSEVAVDTEVRVESRLLDIHSKRFHFYQEMYKTESNVLSATHESVGTVVNMDKRKSTAMSDTLLQKLEAIKAAHSVLEKPWQIGHVLSVNPSR